ncbi:ATP-grasp domain-containing protein [Streptomyces sp. NPDC090119]|uniref:ATP-grasp domain-containing protein n=1 Tax=Streptomyces sp. NPDC090119 TaxID=3365951 RepID=UPI003815C3EA
MKLLAIEARQNATYYVSRYEQIVGLGADLYVLNGEGTDDFWRADRYRVAGSREVAELIAAAKEWHAEERFEGVLTFSESGVLAVAAVAEALGLPGIGLEAARASRNKLLMRQAHERGGAAHPSFRYVTDEAQALAAAEEFGYPVIVKPTLGAASNYVFRADDAAELRARHTQAAEGLTELSWYAMEAGGLDLGPHGLLIESFLDGDEYLIEAVVWDDEVYLGSIVDRVTAEGDTFDDDVHHAPTALTPEQVTAVHEVVAAGARAQGLVRSVMHAEVRFHDGRPHLVEIAARPGGGGLDHMARISAGHDPIAALADVARGVRPDVRHYTPTGTHTAAMCLLPPGSGRVEEIHVSDRLVEHDGVFFFKLTARPGDLVRRPPEGNSILGFLGVTGTSFEDAMSTAEDLAGQVRADLR